MKPHNPFQNIVYSLAGDTAKILAIILHKHGISDVAITPQDFEKFSAAFLTEATLVYSEQNGNLCIALRDRPEAMKLAHEFQKKQAEKNRTN